MKRTMTLIGCLFLLFSSNAGAFCDSGSSVCRDRYYTYAYASGCSAVSSCYNPCTLPTCPYDSPCECTDPGHKWNDCMSCCRYCEAFGNVGGR